MGWLVVLLVIVAIVGFAALLVRFRKPRPLRVEEAADIIEAFAEGKASGAYQWDDFMTYPHQDPQMIAIVKECEAVEIKFPPRHDKEWCSNEGAEELKRIAARVRTLAPRKAG